MTPCSNHKRSGNWASGGYHDGSAVATCQYCHAATTQAKIAENTAGLVALGVLVDQISTILVDMEGRLAKLEGDRALQPLICGDQT